MRWPLWLAAWPALLVPQERVALPTPAGTHQLVRIPAGSFSMGSDSGKADERPVHQVYLDAYYIDVFEVTGAQYAAFLNTIGRHTDAEGRRLLDLDDFDAPIRLEGTGYGLKSPELAHRPVVEVTWFGARAYCRWAGLRLPTEAEWEKAARGTDARIYPWGQAVDPTRANYGADPCCGADAADGHIASAPVGSFPSGASPYGLFDMAGNVWELVQDWYGGDYYARPEARRNPTGPALGALRVIRGGSWSSRPFRLRTSERAVQVPELSYVLIGFRCAGDGALLAPSMIESRSWGALKSGINP